VRLGFQFTRRSASNTRYSKLKFKSGDIYIKKTHEN
jgi:hypothetical protein